MRYPNNILLSAAGHGSAAATPAAPRAGALGSRRVVASRAAPALLLLAGVVLWRGLVAAHPVVSRAAGPGVDAGAALHRELASLPPAAQGVISATLGGESPAYRVSGFGDGYRASNPAQHLRARFARGGVHVLSGGVRLGLHLSAAGYGASLVALAPALPRAQGNRVEYAHAGLNEWYANGPLGLEQGFTLARAPRGDASEPLTLSLTLSGNARAALDASRRGLTLATPGSAPLRYAGLLASDARGRALHSWITLRPGRVLLHVDARGARYPLRIDPLIQQGAKLTAKEETGAGDFGGSVALSANGSTALVSGGADNSGRGAVWVFTRSQGKWTQQAKLTGGKEETEEGGFGGSVALSSNGDTALVGGAGDNGRAGAVWVFTRSEGKWTQQGAILTGGKEETGAAEFGSSVALSGEGNTALIGGWEDDLTEGAAWVFTRSEGKWTQQGAKLTGGKEQAGIADFGFSVALSAEGSTALIGGPADAGDFGAVWVFTRSEGKWAQQGAKLTGTAGKEETGEAFFGGSVALSTEGTTALISGYVDNNGAGAAWVFTRSEGKWAQQGPKLTGKETGAFGDSVALASEGNIALIGDPVNQKEDIGAAWVFTRSEGKWSQHGAKLTGNEETGDAEFGGSVALASEGTTALIGGALDNKSVGAAWVYVFTPTVTTGSATGVAESEATLHGTVSPEGAQAKYHFEYGTTESYGSKTAEASAGSGMSSVEVSSAVTGLASNTKYHYRLVATNSSGTTDGAGQVFTTAHWSLQEPPDPTGAKEGFLAGVSCASSTECIATGFFENSSEKPVPLAEKWNGSTWTAQEPATATGATLSDLAGVSCPSSTGCIAAGFFVNSSEKFLPLAGKWSGSAWTAQEPPDPKGGTEGVLEGVSCVSTTACAAVGHFTSGSKWVPLAEKLDGSTWTAQEPPSAAGAKESALAGVACASSTECIAVGEFENGSEKWVPLAEKWSGSAWTAQEPPIPAAAKQGYLKSVSCTSSTACTAVGEFENGSEKWVPLAEKWSGSAWTAQEPPIPAGAKQGYLKGVSCTSSTACTAVGEFENSSEKVAPLAEWWNGTKWTAQEPPNPTGAKEAFLKGVSCTSSTECTAAGAFENSSSVRVPLAERYQ
jgi:hypothetical protein